MKVIIITRQYCHYNPLYSLAPSKIITSKQRDQPSTYVYVALFILGITTLFIVTATPSTVISFKVVTARQLRIPQISRKMSETSRTRTRNLTLRFRSLQLRPLHRCALFSSFLESSNSTINNKKMPYYKICL